MTPEHWKKVEDVFESALQRPPSERSAFLEAACEGDRSLRNQVETLLLSLERAGDFMESPAVGVGLNDTVVEETPSVIGKRLGSYRIVKEIGRGGMGTVYLATRADDEYQKRVAIKLIKRGMDTDFIVKRFRNERQILAGLDHQHIARLLDGGTTDDGLPYFVMEYVEGEPLYRYCESRRLSIVDRLKLFRRVCSAVHYAHQNHVIHRDLKPGNVLVTANGAPKLLDFGIAKLLNPDLAYQPLDPTTAAVRLMTPEYASPEQVRGETLTAASDVYALGVMLFELLTDHRPYHIKNHLAHELARVICEEEPDLPSVAVNVIEVIGGNGEDPFEITPQTVADARSTTPEQLRRELSGSLDNIVLKALHKDAGRRYASVEEFSEDIRRYLEGNPVSAPSYFPSASRSPLSVAAPTTDSRSIAVLPFQVLRVEEKGEEFLGMGLADAIITKLSNIQRIIVRPTSAVIKYFDGTHNILAAGHELNVGFVLDGRIQRASDRIRVTVQLVSVRDGQPVWAAKFDENYTDIFSVEDSISEQVAHALVPHLSGEERELLLRRETENANAYQAFLKGRYLWNRFTPEDFTKAAEQFREAIQLDPNYAQAYVGIADYYNWAAIFGLGSPGDNFPQAKSAAIRALEIDETLAEAHAALAFTNLCYDWDWSGAEQRFRRALELNGNYGPAHQWYSNLLAAQGRFEEAVNEIRRALEINPLSMMDRSITAFTYYHARQYERAEQELRAALEIDRNFSNTYLMLGFVYERMGFYEESIAALQKATELMAGSAVPLWPLGYTFASCGRKQEARAIIDRLKELSLQTYISPYFIALVHTGLGEKEEAFEWLDKAIAQRDEWLLWIGVEPKLDPLRSDPRFAELLKRVGLRGDETTKAIHYSADQSTDFLSSGTERSRIITGELRPSPVHTSFIPYKQQKPGRAWLFGLGIVGLLLVAAFVVYRASRPTSSHFTTTTLDKLTATGNIVDATISPDGKYIAYVMEETGKQGLWVRQTAIANIRRIVPTSTAQYRGLSFSKDGNYIYYVFTEQNGKDGILSRVPTFGGSVSEIKKDVDSPVSFSPDTKQFTFVRSDVDKGEDTLMIANEDGSGEQQLASMKFPSHYSLRSAPAWSPDGKQVVTVVETADDDGFYTKLSSIDVQSKTERPISSRRWLEISEVGWIPGGGGLIVSAQDNTSPFFHLWLVDPGQGVERRITNDLNDYLSVSLSSEPLSLLTVQRQTLTNIWIEYKNSPGDPMRAMPLTSGAGRFFDLRWTADNKIIYASDASGNADIWEMAADGSNQTQLTAAAGRNYAPVASDDGKYVVFHSNRSGRWQLWRMGRDGSNPLQLTDGKEESNWPDISPDSRWIYFEHIDGGTPKLFKISIDGGTPVKVADVLALRPSVSPDGKLIAFWAKDQSPRAPWKIAIAPIDGPLPTKYLDVPQGLANGQSAIQFNDDNNTVTFIDFNNGISKLISQPIDGSKPSVLTSITKDLFYSFSQAADGRLVMSRGLRTSDAALINERK